MLGRYLSKEEREKIKKAKEKERIINNYVSGAVARMTPKKCRRKLKGGFE